MWWGQVFIDAAPVGGAAYKDERLNEFDEVGTGKVDANVRLYVRIVLCACGQVWVMVGHSCLCMYVFSL